MKKNYTILHVDDEQAFLDLTQKYFTRINQTLEFVKINSPLDAIQLLKNSNEYDIIISDYQMPELDGLSFLEEVQKQKTQIPFIMLTGRGREEIAIKALNSGVDFYLQKQSDIKTLFTELNHFILRILDKKITGTALEESERRYRLMVEQSPFSTVIYRPDGTPIMSNSAMAKLWNLSPEEMEYLTHNYNIFQDPQLQEKGLMPYIEKGFTGKSVVLPPIKYDPQDSGHPQELAKHKSLWVKTYLYPVKDETGELQQVVLIQENITEDKLYEEYLERQKKELADFSMSMAHDIGNAIQTIRGYAEILSTDYKKDYIDKILNVSKNINSILVRSLELAEQGLVVNKNDLVDLCTIAKESAKTVLPTGINFICDKIPIIAGDKEKLHQIFVNILENAVVHGNPSKIEIKSHSSSDGQSHILSIINDGTPIASQDQAKIFEKGFTSKGEGHGLGLSIVQRIIEAHGWKIKLDSSSELQTVFQIIIPS